jgi:hypothetical protein
MDARERPLILQRRRDRAAVAKVFIDIHLAAVNVLANATHTFDLTVISTAWEKI